MLKLELFVEIGHTCHFSKLVLSFMNKQLFTKIESISLTFDVTINFVFAHYYHTLCQL